MTRARSTCSADGCPHVATRAGRCELHAPRPWAGSEQRRRALGVPHGHAMRKLDDAVRRRARDRCERCGQLAARPAGTIDHRVPVALGGDSTLTNLWLLCDSCDAAKTRADLAEIRRRRLDGRG